MYATLRTHAMAAVSAALLFVSTSAAGAQQQRPLFQWRGQVDREAQIVMRGNDLETRFTGWERSPSRGKVQGYIPRSDGFVTVQTQRGRGQVDVVQQPSARNGYTAIVRVRDDRPGADAYQLHAFWRPSYNDGRGGSWGNGNDHARGRDHDDDGDDDHGYGHGRGSNDGAWHRGSGQGGHGDGGYGRGGNGGYGDGGYGDGGYGRGGNGGYGSGYGSGSLHWSGNVDNVVDIRIQGQRVDYATVSGNPVSGVRSRIDGGGLGQGARVTVRENSGRGSVIVLQQPSAQNGWSALVRVIDRAGGAAWYDLDISW